MKQFLKVLVVLVAAWTALPAASAPSKKPKLVLSVVIDQFRYDYLVRFRADYRGGLARMLDQGAVFTNAHYEHFPTVTAVGHATILSGALPSVSGIVGNEWYDRNEAKQVTSVTDDTVQALGASGRKPASPGRLLVSTVGDELKMASRGRPKVIGISMKDRSAILPVGRMADAAYWFDDANGNFVSSSYYFKMLPGWVSDFNRSRASDKYLGRPWTPFDAPGGKPFSTMPAALGAPYYAAMERSPFGNDILEVFAERAVEAEQLGQRQDTDLLSISFSANDRVGHDLGPDSPQVRDISICTDRVLGKLFDYLESKIGMGNVLVVLTADHGVAPLPEVMQQRKMPGGRMTEKVIEDAVDKTLSERYGPAKWVIGKSGPAPYLDHNLIRQKGLDAIEVRKVAAAAVARVPHIQRVYTRDQLALGQLPGDPTDQRVRNGFHANRAADLFVVSEPYWLFEQKGTSHGTPYNYDSHVPIVFMGPGIKAGTFRGRITVNDIAPTLSEMLEVETPSGSIGRALEEIRSN